MNSQNVFFADVWVRGYKNIPNSVFLICTIFTYCFLGPTNIVRNLGYVPSYNSADLHKLIGVFGLCVLACTSIGRPASHYHLVHALIMMHTTTTTTLWGKHEEFFENHYWDLKGCVGIKRVGSIVFNVRDM